MNEQNTQGASQKAIGTGEGESPMTQFNPQNVIFRTQVSDIKSMQQSGGGKPEGYSLESKMRSVPESPTAQAGEEQAFQPPKIPVQSVPLQAPVVPPTNIPGAGAPQGAKSSRKIFAVVIALIVLAGLAFVGYAVVYPVFFEGGESAIESSKTPASGETDSASNERDIKGDASAVPDDGGTPVIPASNELPTKKKREYVSVFSNAVQSIRSAEISSLSYEEIMKGFGTDSSALPEFRENRFVTGNNVPLAAELMSVMLPLVFADGALSGMGDYSMFSYVDRNGTWPGVVIQVAENADAAGFTAAFQAAMEKASSATLARLYTKDPGAAQGGWKQGQTQEVKNRYLVFGSGEAAVSLNYGWFGETLVLSTSYDGFKTAVQYLR